MELSENLWKMSLVSPPPPSSECNNGQHSGYCNKIRRFSSEELMEVTDGYSADNKFNYQHELLFRGNLDGQRVYVVRREPHEKLKFFSEVNILGSLRHPNIAILKGYCDEENHLSLVFDFVCNGNLSFHLGAKCLNTSMQWSYRANLAVQLAKTLVYLHDKGIIHGNVNSMYVFVHRNWTPLIAKFDLARNIRDGRDVILQDRSGDLKSRGYLAPEYKPGAKVSMEQDIYAFGVILFELISGRPAFDRRSKTNKFLGEWGRETVEGFQETDQWNLLRTMADGRLKYSDVNMCDMLRMIKVAALCTKKDLKKRPLMTEVLEMLTGDIEQSQSPESPVVPKQTDSEVQGLLTEETEIERRQTPDHPGAFDRRVHWADQDTDAAETARILSDDNKTFGKRLSMSEISANFLRELKIASKVTRYYREASSNRFNYYQGSSSRRDMRPPPTPATSFWRPSSPGNRLNRYHLRVQHGYSGPPSPKSSTASSRRRLSSLANSGGIPMSLLRVNVIIKFYASRSCIANSVESRSNYQGPRITRRATRLLPSPATSIPRPSTPGDALE